ncbi:hypothetical protein BPO_1466 [Bergeyella porcorum]|uniref:Uncharacterized protein n=2 Tax=Bergeyella porcorum TaxID=1735111 RepID=A0AAU0F5P6_9FLAO
MPKVDKDLYFVIDEKNNQIDLTDKGVEYMSAGNEDKDFFVLQDIGTEIAELEAKNLPKEEEFAAKEELFRSLQKSLNACIPSISCSKLIPFLKKTMSMW